MVSHAFFGAAIFLKTTKNRPLSTITACLFALKQCEHARAAQNQICFSTYSFFSRPRYNQIFSQLTDIKFGFLFWRVPESWSPPLEFADFMPFFCGLFFHLMHIVTLFQMQKLSRAGHHKAISGYLSFANLSWKSWEKLPFMLLLFRFLFQG